MHRAYALYAKTNDNDEASLIGRYGPLIDRLARRLSMRIGIPSSFDDLWSAGALGLIIGFCTRLCALGIALVMGGAIFFVHGQHGFFMNWAGKQAGEGFEYHLLAIGLALALMIHGGGKWSFDQRIAR